MLRLPHLTRSGRLAVSQDPERQRKPHKNRHKQNSHLPRQQNPSFRSWGRPQTAGAHLRANFTQIILSDAALARLRLPVRHSSPRLVAPSLGRLDRLSTDLESRARQASRTANQEAVDRRGQTCLCSSSCTGTPARNMAQIPPHPPLPVPILDCWRYTDWEGSFGRSDAAVRPVPTTPGSRRL